MIETSSTSYEAWRTQARSMLLQGVPPQKGQWDLHQASLFEVEVPLRPLATPKVPPEFLNLALYASAARDEDRWDLLYRILYRLNHENPHLLKVTIDPDVHRLNLLYKSVRRDIHKMHAFVRFKRSEINGIETYVAWHKPEHLTIELGTPFFVRRFGDKPWSIFSPDGSAHWNLHELSFGKGLSQREFEHEDPFDDVWKTYYRSIFNPARIKMKAMRAEMAPKYWSSLPEAEIISELIRNTPKQLQNMRDSIPTLAQPPVTTDWNEVKKAASVCSACPLAAPATQVVFGEGPLDARLMIVGEQPGDSEDLAGQNFVGPAGEILNMALAEAGLVRDSIYVTNAVKHFKFTREGKVRIHKKASGSEMHSCKPWLEAEIARVQPQVILCLGATAGTAVYGRLVKIQTERGIPYTESGFAKTLLISWHPAAILRSTSEEEKNMRFAQLVQDLKLAAASINPPPGFLSREAKQ